MTLRTLNYGNYGIFLIMGHAGFCPSTVVSLFDVPTAGSQSVHVSSHSNMLQHLTHLSGSLLFAASGLTYWASARVPGPVQEERPGR